MNLTKQFFLGGNATFTVLSGKSGRHMTFRIRKPDPTEQFPNPKYLVSAMTGPDNERSYSYMGVLNEDTGSITPSNKSKLLPNSEQWRVVAWALGKVWRNEQPTGGTEIKHEGRCGCCGHKLTTPESLDRGIGPDCWERIGGK